MVLQIQVYLNNTQGVDRMKSLLSAEEREIILTPDTSKVITKLEAYVRMQRLRSEKNHTLGRLSDSEYGTIEGLTHRLMNIEQLLQNEFLIRDNRRAMEQDGFIPIGIESLQYDEIMETIPIYSDTLVLAQRSDLISWAEIPAIASLLRIPSTSNGVEIENHGRGLHFHYGTVKNHSLERYDLLLTFNSNLNAEPIVLYAENHGKYRKIDIRTMYENKRRPIYDVCHGVLNKRGIANFRLPKKNAVDFYPIGSIQQRQDR